LAPEKRITASISTWVDAVSRGDAHGGAGGRGAGLDGGALVEVVSVFAPAITIINMVTVAGVAGDLGVPGVSSS